MTELLNRGEVAALCKVHPSQIDRYRKGKNCTEPFPEPVTIRGKRTPLWDRHAVEGWLLGEAPDAAASQSMHLYRLRCVLKLRAGETAEMFAAEMTESGQEAFGASVRVVSAANGKADFEITWPAASGVTPDEVMAALTADA